MRKNILLLFFILFVTYGKAQNYYREYPINALIAFNGTQQRMELSVYDSILQTTVIYNSPWMNFTILMNSGNGKVDFTTWVTPFQENADHGFIVYDFLLHQFAVKWFNNGIAPNQVIYTGSGIKWFAKGVQSSLNNFQYNLYYYRYNIQFHEWDEAILNVDNQNGNPILPGSFNTSGVSDMVYEIDHLDEGHFNFYDAVTGNFIQFFSGCAGWGTHISDDYLAIDTGCQDNYILATYDASFHYFSSFPRGELLGDHVNGVYSASDQYLLSHKFFFTFDEAIHQWLADSIVSTNINFEMIKDRVTVYVNQTPGFSKKIFYMTHNPVLHTLVKDSTTIVGLISGVTIENGTVKWTDANGLNIRGYDINTGWGNYVTPLFLNFHLTDFTSQGLPMVHVRNYTIGTGKIYFDFGDGTISTNYQNSMWHYYSNPGTYNICIYDSSGTQSSCQSVSYVFCSQSGVASTSNSTICYGDSLTLSLSGNTGSIQWQRLNGTIWMDETGAGSTTNSYTLLPLQNAIFRASVTNGICVSAITNSLPITVEPIAFSGTVFDTSYYLCSGGVVKLKITGYTGSIQWQRNTGSGWINIFTGTTSLYNDVITVTSQYRAILTSGNCTTDTSDIINAEVIPIPAMPSTTGSIQCGDGFTTLSASGTGTLNWYTGLSFSTQLVNTGPTFTTFIDTTTSYFVHSITGTNQTAGYADNTFGNVSNMNCYNTGIRIISSTPATIEKITVYPQQTGIMTFTLYKSSTNEFVATVSVNIVNSGVPKEVYLGIGIQGNEQYDLMMESTNFQLQVNTSNVSYPITVTGSDVTILGYLNSNFFTDSSFYNYYNIKVSTGCSGNPKIVTASHYNEIVSSMTAAGPLSFCQGGSVALNAIPTGNFFYNWLKNGVSIPGVISSNYTATTAGNYSVSVSNIACSDTSNTMTVTVPCIQIFDPGEKVNPAIEESTPTQFNTYFDASSGSVYMNLITVQNENYKLSLIDLSGRELITEIKDFFAGENELSINVQNLTIGLYIIRARSNNNNFVKKFLKY